MAARISHLLVVIVLGAALGACFGRRAAGPAPSANVAKPASAVSVTRFTGIPMPPNNALDLDRTVVVGGDADWVGRIVFTNPMTVDATVEYYRREMPQYGWSELAATRSSTSVLSYQAGARIATIQLQSQAEPAGTPRGTRVEFWVNPRPSAQGPTSVRADTPSTAEISSSADSPLPPLPRTPVEQAPLPPSINQPRR